MSKKTFKNRAFSLIEISIVIVIIGILIVGITQGSRLVKASKLASAKNLTKSSDVAAIKGLAFWHETTLENPAITGSIASSTDDSKELKDDDRIEAWININPVLSQNLIATSDSARPTYKEDILNGLPVIRFTRANNSFLATQGAFLNTHSLSIFIVARFESVLGAALIGTGDITTNGDILLESRDNGEYYYRSITRSSSSYNSLGNSGVKITDDWVIYNLNVNASSKDIRRNGVIDFSGVMAGGRIQTLKQIFIGAQNATTDHFGGDMAEIIIYERHLAKNEIKYVENYLSKKWGIKLK